MGKSKTPTVVTPGCTDEGTILQEVIGIHEQNTLGNVATAVADSRYGTIESFLTCSDSGIQAHIPSLEESQRGFGRRGDIFPKEAFAYPSDTDTFTCPAGKKLRRRHFYKDRMHTEYKAATGVCARGHLRPKCTRSESGRTLKRHVWQDELDQMLKQSRSLESQEDIKTGWHLSERSFTWSVRYGDKRARWRRLWRVQIQDFLIAAIENIMILISRLTSSLSKSKGPIGRAAELVNSLIKKSRFSLNAYCFCPISRSPKRFGQQPVETRPHFL